LIDAVKAYWCKRGDIVISSRSLAFAMSFWLSTRWILVDYSQETFDKIVAEYRPFAEKIGLQNVQRCRSPV